MNNPFNPSFGKVPNIFLDRAHAVTKLSTELQDPNSPYRDNSDLRRPRSWQNFTFD